jgi:Anti-sigma factor NepR
VQGEKDLDEGNSLMNSIGGGATSASEPALPLDAQTQIGRRLASLYNEVLQQPVPDRFRLLLDELDQKTGPSKRAKPDEGSAN